MALLKIVKFQHEESIGSHGTGIPIPVADGVTVTYGDVITVGGTKGSITEGFGIVAMDSGNFARTTDNYVGGVTIYGEANSIVRVIQRGWVMLDTALTIGTPIYLGASGTLDSVADIDAIKVGRVMRDSGDVMATTSKYAVLDFSPAL